jgi:hypothetical protein
LHIGTYDSSDICIVYACRRVYCHSLGDAAP